MFKSSIALISAVLFILVFGCSSGSIKPGMGGTGSAKDLGQDDHPEFPEGVSCYVCHKDDIPEHEFHRDFGRKCDECHVLTTWMAQKYPHSEWPLDEIHNVRCTRCHTKSSAHDYTYYQCYGCHHEEAGIKKSHAKLGDRNLSLCADCHNGFAQKSGANQ